MLTGFSFTQNYVTQNRNKDNKSSYLKSIFIYKIPIKFLCQPRLPTPNYLSVIPTKLTLDWEEIMCMSKCCCIFTLHQLKTWILTKNFSRRSHGIFCTMSFNSFCSIHVSHTFLKNKRKKIKFYFIFAIFFGILVYFVFIWLFMC